MAGRSGYTLAEVRRGTGWPPGARFALLAGDGPQVYLSAADIAGHFGVSVAAVHAWRARYGPDRAAAAVAKAPTCPQPDVLVGLGKPQAGWLKSRLPEWEAWRASLPGQGAGGGRPKKS